MKKHEVYEGLVSALKFPNKGIVEVDGEKCIIKNVLPGQHVLFRVTKKRSGVCEGNLLEVLGKAPNECDPACKHFGICGGCSYQNLPYEEQLKLKESQVRELMKNVQGLDNYEELMQPIVPSPVRFEYRNKMEFSFGDSCKDGELELGLHKKGSFYDIISVKDCQIIDSDFRKILTETLAYFRGKETTYYHKRTHEGFLRHLLVRKAVKTGEILVDLVTSSQTPMDTICCEKGILEDWVDVIKSIKFDGKIAGILHTTNDSVADTVINEKTDILYGQDYFYEEILGLKFKITPFSFFQTNSLSAEVLYSIARKLVLEGSGNDDGVTSTAEGLNDSTVYDLYSGTGTIAQLLSLAAEKVVGVEIVEEAVEAAKANAELNGLHNCEFLAGDVLKVLDDIEEKPDYIILDPPRDGINPKALFKIINYGVDNIVYISCKPTSLARDLEVFLARGYDVKTIIPIDQFPGTVHVETVVLLSRKIPDAVIDVELRLSELDLTKAESKATYDEIREYVQNKYGFHVSNLNIAQVKRKHGIIEHENYYVRVAKNRVPGTPKEKFEAIEDALRYYQMI